MLYYPNQFLTAFNAGNDIAVHTWTHPYMTTLSNLDVLGQVKKVPLLSSLNFNGFSFPKSLGGPCR